jgi:uncharacterized protein (TIGR02271 family)
MAAGSTIVGVFHDKNQAQQAVAELRRQGFREDLIGVTTRHDSSGSATEPADGNYAAEGAAAGVAAGAGVGALWGLGILAGALPAIGPAIAGGTLAVLLSSAAAGAAAAGLAGTLIGLGMSKEEAEYYESEFRAGRTIVTVRVNGNRSVAQEILRRFGAYDMSTRGEASTLAGSSMAGTSAMTGSSHMASSPSTAQPARTATHTGTHGQTVQAREEQLKVQKQPVQTGEVTVRKEVHTERKTIEVPVQREEIVVERHPVSGNRPAGAIGTGSSEEIRVPVTEEQVHVEKQPVVVEEVSVGKRKVQDTKRVDATVRKEEIKVEKKGSADDVCER